MALASSSSSSSAAVSLRLLLYAVSKRNNIGMLMRSACAFGVEEIVAVGRRRNFPTHGAQGTQNFVRMRFFDRFDEAVAYLRGDGFRIVGVEIKDTARRVDANPFHARTAFVLGNEGQGLNDKATASCDEFVYIKQVGQGTASLNVAVAGSIVMHQFCVWAGTPEQERQGAKFVVDETARVNYEFEQRARKKRKGENQEGEEKKESA